MQNTSVSDLTTYIRTTSGEVPPHLVGASSTVYNSKLYLFGGRYNVESTMSSDIFELDLNTWVWTKLDLTTDQNRPKPRYFHSADTWQTYLVIFGGMGYKDAATKFDKSDLCIFDDLRLFDLGSKQWLPANTLRQASSSQYPMPGARYAHLSSLNGNRFTIIGGQDLDSQWLGDVHVYDLEARRWIASTEYPKYCGAYRSIIVSSPHRVVTPPSQDTDSSGFPGVQPSFQLQNAPLQSFRPRSPLIHLPYAEPVSPNEGCDLYLYSNYNFTDVKREMVEFNGKVSGEFDIIDRSEQMGGNNLPPGLRFPTGGMIGTHIIIAGTYLAHTHQSFAVWSFDTSTMSWTRLETGAALSAGSWCRGAVWAETNKFLVFGNRAGNLVDDYNRRILSWNDVAVMDLEAYGIYLPPFAQLDLEAQELGLAALEEELLADFEMVCDDGRRIKCNRKILESRWPWFEKQRRSYGEAASRALENIPRNDADIPLPRIPGLSESDESPPDPRLTPRSFYLSEPFAITTGFVQYLYSLSLMTRIQHAPGVLNGLMILASTYELPHLGKLVTHAMHRVLSQSTSIGIYETATLCSVQALQIRSLRYLMKKDPYPRQQSSYRSTLTDGSESTRTATDGNRDRSFSTDNYSYQNSRSRTGTPEVNGYRSIRNGINGHL